MSKERYQPILRQLEHLCAQLDSTSDFSHRFMFGGVGLYTRGSIFGTLMGLDDDTVSLALKLPAGGRESLNTGESIPEPPGGKQYASIPPSIAADDDRLMEWLECSLTHTHALAVKKSGKKKL
ncbi:MAG: TfoX/Sxy family protein [Anaerolineae bacterium]